MRTFDGSRMQEAREKIGMTRNHLAIELMRQNAVRGYLDRRQVHLWETSDRAPRANTLAAIADILGVPIDSLFRPADEAAA